MKGFITIDRAFFDHTLWKEKRTYSRAEAWIDLIQRASFTTANIIVAEKEITIHPGETAISRSYLEPRWGWGNTKIRNYIKLLLAHQMITTRTTKQITILKIEKFNTYALHAQQHNQPNNQATTSQQPHNNHNIKKGKKENKGNGFFTKNLSDHITFTDQL